MSTLVEMLKKRQGETHPEDFAREIGVRSSTVYSWYNGRRSIGVDGARNLAQYAKRRNDKELLLALGSYVLGVDLPNGTSPN
jgi:transcriptional regulator with XRE-family HTH domain